MQHASPNKKKLTKLDQISGPCRDSLDSLVLFGQEGGNPPTDIHRKRCMPFSISSQQSSATSITAFPCLQLQMDMTN